MKKNFVFSIFLVVLAFLVACTKNETTISEQNVALFGDSMTWYGGDSCELERGWTYHFKRAVNPKSITLYARSGATWSNTDSTVVDTKFYTGRLNDKNVIYTQIQRLIDSTSVGMAPRPDVILVYAGANDCWYSDRRPGLFSLSAKEALESAPYPDSIAPNQVTSLAGSVRLGCDILRKNFPEARIVLMTPIQMVPRSVEEVERVANIIDSVGTGLGLEVLRADKLVGIRHDAEKEQMVYTIDGVHTTPAGAKLIADFVAASLQ